MTKSKVNLNKENRDLTKNIIREGCTMPLCFSFTSFQKLRLPLTKTMVDYPAIGTPFGKQSYSSYSRR